MKLTLLIPILLCLLHSTLATSETSRFLAGCTEGCIICSRDTNLCSKCDDDYTLDITGVCVENVMYNDMLYLKSDHFLLVDIDHDGVDIPVIVIFAILAFFVYLGSLFLMQKQDWKELVPEVKEPAKIEGGKEHAKQPTPKGEHVVDINAELRQTPTPKSATPGSPAKSAQLGSHRSKKTVQEEEDEENIEVSQAKDQEEIAEEDEEPYYPTKKEMAARNRRDEEDEEEEEDADQVQVHVHDGENNDEDEQRTAQETPSPKTEARSSPNGSVKRKAANRRKGSHHSDADEEEDDDNRPYIQSETKHNQHRGNEGEDEEEEFESARSNHGRAQEEEEEEEEDEEEQEDVMDLNDLGLEAGEKKH